MTEKKIKVYVAGPSTFARACAAFMGAMEEYGFEITHDWTLHLDSSDYVQEAIDDYEAVKAADCLIHFYPEEFSHGAYWECGVAYALGKPVFVYGVTDKEDLHIFHQLPDVQVFQFQYEMVLAIREAFNGS